jgi:hypothetical protein
MIVFQNTGNLDTKLLTTFGVSAKETDNPIGYFGTGLKYALAVLLRTGHEIAVHDGRAGVHVLGTKSETARDGLAAFDVVTINGKPTAFTLGLGKNWEVWQAYRELACNAYDEKGGIVARAQTYPDGRTLSQRATPKTYARREEPGTVSVVVKGEGIERVHDSRFPEVFAPRHENPVIVNGRAIIAPYRSEYIYNKGIRVAELRHPAQNIYDLLGHLSLTEDRTVRYEFEVRMRVAQAIALCDNESLIEKALLAPQGWYEHGLDYDQGSPSDVFRAVVERLCDTRYADIPPSALKICGLEHGKLAARAQNIQDLADQLEVRRFDKAIRFCRRIGFPVGDYPIRVVESLSPGVMGMAHEGSIYVTRKALDMGTKALAGTLIEEYLHLSRSCEDCTREMQNILVDSLVTMGERVTGEPL